MGLCKRHITFSTAGNAATEECVIRICDEICLSLCFMDQPLYTELLVYCIHAKTRLASKGLVCVCVYLMLTITSQQLFHTLYVSFWIYHVLTVMFRERISY